MSYCVRFHLLIRKSWRGGKSKLVDKAKLSNEQTEQLTIAAQAQFKVTLTV